MKNQFLKNVALAVLAVCEIMKRELSIKKNLLADPNFKDTSLLCSPWILLFLVAESLEGDSKDRFQLLYSAHERIGLRQYPTDSSSPPLQFLFVFDSTSFNLSLSSPFPGRLLKFLLEKDDGKNLGELGQTLRCLYDIRYDAFAPKYQTHHCKKLELDEGEAQQLYNCLKDKISEDDEEQFWEIVVHGLEEKEYCDKLTKKDWFDASISRVKEFLDRPLTCSLTSTSNVEPIQSEELENHKDFFEMVLAQEAQRSRPSLPFASPNGYLAFRSVTTNLEDTCKFYGMERDYIQVFHPFFLHCLSNLYL